MKCVTWEKIDQLRERVSDIAKVDKKFSHDFYLHQWLLHFSMKLDRTENAIREAIKWRKENNIEILADQPWDAEAPGISRAIVVDSEIYSKTGIPVMTFSAESIDFRTLFETYGKEAILRFYIKWLRKLEKQMYEENLKILQKESKGGKLILNEFDSKCCPPQFPPAPIFIISYKNFSLWNATSMELLQTLMEFTKYGMSYFPLPLSKVYVINMNKFSSVMFKLLKPILSTLPISIECYGTDKAIWSKALLEQIDADQLTPYFGGTKGLSKDAQNLV